MNILYLECAMGAAGDMLMGALYELYPEKEKFLEKMNSLLPGVAVEAERIVTHASITARPFFEKRGYRTLRERRVLRHGVPLTNYHMEKRRFPAAQNACYSAENAVAPQAETE